jgi:hypothetical protein
VGVARHATHALERPEELGAFALVGDLIDPVDDQKAIGAT